ncbi:MAG: hypothetical protein ACRC2R_25970 [Xenococcaceae cyanobacterium]
MADYQEYKIPTFPQINDSPIPPTAQTAGNGSHFIDRYNGALEALEGDINQLQEILQEQGQETPSQPQQDDKIFNAILAWGMGV